VTDQTRHLVLDDVCAGYGVTPVLFDVSLAVGHGETVAVVGRNGSGRSTLLKAIAGRTRRHGRIALGGVETIELAPFEVARTGIAYVPESREIFGHLTVEENLILGERRHGPRGIAWSLAKSYELFPRLAERKLVPAGVLSGGEQQMLALARALMSEPRLLLIDEPTEGLSPPMVRLVADTLASLGRSGVSILLVEQKLDIALELARRVYVMGRGKIVFEGSPEDLRADHEVRSAWIEV
jgi:branched-chain amino acid transport system ATP-binding protein